MLDIRLLGPLEVAASARPVALAGGRERSLLALLAVHRDRVVGVDEILESLWRDEPLRDPRHALQASVARLRRMLREAGGHDAVVATHGPGYRIDRGVAVSFDVERFRRFVGEAERDVQADPASASAALTEALALFRGDPLADFTYEEWAQVEISRLNEQRLAATADRIEIDLRLGRHARQLPDLESLVREHPYHEGFRALLMLALYRSGRQEAALATYHDGRKLLDEDLGIDPGPDLRRIEQAILRHDPEIAPAHDVDVLQRIGAPPRLPTAGPRSGNLPLQLTSFIGRDDDVTRLSQLLAEHRLVTLVGAGGSGKTRLAIEISLRRKASFPHGTWFVDLSSTISRGDAERAIGAVLDVHENYEQTLGRGIVEYLRDRRALLILDNCEHALDELAPLIENVLGGTTELVVLVTSRESLGTPGEALWPVEALAIPGTAGSDGRPTESPSFRLFIERARLVEPRFELDDATTRDVISICRSTDGIPLAIELAAGQLAAMTVSDIAARLRERPIALGEQRRGSESRRQTFEAAIGRSYELLDESERAVFRGLSVFEGGFSLTGAESTIPVASTDGDVGDVLVRLVRKSTLTQGAGSGSSSRYRMLEPIRRFALDRLRDVGDEDAARDRHLGFVADLAGQASRGLRSPRQARWLRVVDVEYANLLAALRRAQARDEHDDAMLIGTALGPYWRVRGFLSEGRSIGRGILDGARGDRATRATLLSDVGMLTFFQCDYQETQALGRMALDVLGERARGPEPAYALLVDGLASWKVEGYRVGIQALQRSVDAYQAAGDAWGASTALAYSGMMLMDGGELGAAGELHEQGLLKLREQGDEWGMALSLSALGSLRLASGRIDEAEAFLSEALELSQRIDDRWATARARMYLARIALARGDTVAAREGLDAAMDGYHRLRDREDAALCLRIYAALALEDGAVQDAAMLLGAADALRRTVAATFVSGSIDRAGDGDLRERLVAELGEGGLDRWLQRGGRLSWDEAMAFLARGGPGQPVLASA